MLWADSRICGFADSHVGFTFCGRYAERGLGIQSVFFFPPTAFPSSSADPPVVGQARLVTFDRSKVTKKPCTPRNVAFPSTLRSIALTLLRWSPSRRAASRMGTKLYNAQPIPQPPVPGLS